MAVCVCLNNTDENWVSNCTVVLVTVLDGVLGDRCDQIYYTKVGDPGVLQTIPKS